MRRAILLALVAMTLPTATLASSISFTTGTFGSGTITSNLGNPFSVSVVGTNGTTIMLSNITLVPSCSPGSVSTCTFSSGTLTVGQSGSVVFTSSLSNGILKKSGSGGNTISIAASIVPSTCGSIPCTSGTVLFNNLMKEGNHLTGGVATVSVTVVPEPSSLGLLGTGLIGLAGIGMRKRRRSRMEMRLLNRSGQA